MDMNFGLYMNGVVEQTRNEIESTGYEQLTIAEDVDKVPKQGGTASVMINSVCGCVGGITKPAASYALRYDVLPDHLVAVFAGRDKEATQKAHECFEGYAPSSPSFVLVKDGRITEVVERHQIEGYDMMDVIDQLQALFNKYCEGR